MNKLIKSFDWATNGISTAWCEEANFRIEALAGFGVVMLGIYLGFSQLEWVIIIGCIGFVLSAEMVNTAVEDLCDRIEPSHDPVIGKVKDIMSGFVLIVSLTALIIGLVVFSNYF